MPRFSDKEKETIQQQLLTQGEKLFTDYGLKKVTVDELAKAAGISKGSFYAFYESKEHLYFAIAELLQKQIWAETEAYLQQHRTLPPKQLLLQTYLWIFSQMEKYPMLLHLNGDTAETLYRKLPAEVIEKHTGEDTKMLELLLQYGIRFTCDIELATATLQTLAITFFHLRQENSPSQPAVMELILKGVINQLVEDDT